MHFLNQILDPEPTDRPELKPVYRRINLSDDSDIENILRDLKQNSIANLHLPFTSTYSGRNQPRSETSRSSTRRNDFKKEVSRTFSKSDHARRSSEPIRSRTKATADSSEREFQGQKRAKQGNKRMFLDIMISLSLSESQFNGKELKTSFLSNWVHFLKRSVVVWVIVMHYFVIFVIFQWNFSSCV